MSLVILRYCFVLIMELLRVKFYLRYSCKSVSNLNLHTK